MPTAMFDAGTRVYVKALRDEMTDLPGEFIYIGPNPLMTFTVSLSNSTIPDEYHRIKCTRGENPYIEGQEYICSGRRLSDSTWANRVATTQPTTKQRGKRSA